MIQAEMRALVVQFLAPLAVPVYAADQVPPGAACPYLTYAMTGAGFGGRGSLTLTAWTRGDFARCVALMDGLCGLLCGGKAILSGQHGVAMVAFEQADTIQAPADRSMTGGRVRLSMLMYEQWRGGGEGC